MYPRGTPDEQARQQMEEESRRRIQESLKEASRKTGFRVFGGAPWTKDELPPARISPRWSQQDEQGQADYLEQVFTAEQPAPPAPKRSHHKKVSK